MRSFLGFVVFVAILVALLAFVVVPLVARPLIVAMVRDAAPLEGPPLEVEVDAGLGMVTGTISRIRVRGESQTSGRTTIETLDLEVDGFGLLDRSFDSLVGSLGGVWLVLDDGTTLAIRSIQLAGPSATVAATTSLDAAATEGLARASLARGGIVPDRVVLGPGTITIEVAGVAIQARLEARGGALVFVPDQLLPPVTVFAPEVDAVWRLTAAALGPEGLTLVADIDAEALLGG